MSNVYGGPPSVFRDSAIEKKIYQYLTEEFAKVHKGTDTKETRSVAETFLQQLAKWIDDETEKAIVQFGSRFDSYVEIFPEGVTKYLTESSKYDYASDDLVKDPNKNYFLSLKCLLLYGKALLNHYEKKTSDKVVGEKNQPKILAVLRQADFLEPMPEIPEDVIAILSAQTAVDTENSGTAIVRAPAVVKGSRIIPPDIQGTDSQERLDALGHVLEPPALPKERRSAGPSNSSSSVL